MSSALMTCLLAFGFGAVCMLLGFYLIVRGIGAADSESTIKLIGIEIRTSRVGPGVLFALFGLVLTIIAIQKLPSDANAGPKTAANPAPASASPASATAPAPIPVADQPAAPSAAPPKPPEPEPDPTLARRQHEADYIRQALTRISGGYCPDDLMTPALTFRCGQQLPMMQATLSQAGPIQGVSFAGVQQTPYGGVDAFAVQYSGGPAVWKVMLSADGRLDQLWYGAP